MKMNSAKIKGEKILKPENDKDKDRNQWTRKQTKQKIIKAKSHFLNTATKPQARLRERKHKSPK